MAKKNSSKNKSLSIPERQSILAWLQTNKAPQTLQQCAESFQITTPAERTALGRRLRAMTRDGELLRNRRGGYGIVEKMNLIRGRTIGHADGYGFLSPDDGGQDLYLSAREMKSLLHGDRALVRIVKIDNKGRLEGSLVEVLERANTKITGKLRQTDSLYYVIPDNKHLHQDILIEPQHINSAKAGQFVSVEISRQPQKHLPPTGKIIQIIGNSDTPGMAVDLAIHSYDLPHTWSTAVMDACLSLPDNCATTSLDDRTDLRDLPLVTIDGETAQDFDDAVYGKPHGDGWLLLVAIADVSHYVRTDSAIDKEAQQRGTSVYFPGRVLPMLPEQLSNGLCSLKPQVDRLCLVCELIINATGDIQQTRFFRAIMRSAARLTYTEVAAMLFEKDAASQKRYASLLPHLQDLQQIFTCLRAKRRREGMVDFATTESHLIYDAQGKIAEIHPLLRNDAHRLIEELMLAANVAAGEYLTRLQLPILYRIHDKPKAEKLTQIRTFLGELGLQLDGGDTPTISDYAALMQTIAERTDRHLIEMMLLRSMQLAVYHANNIGHFGLGFPVYTHFTSPIRRYPDLLVHRAICHQLAGHAQHEFHYNAQQILHLGDHCSMLERRAEEASRDALQRLKCEFMQDKVGQRFTGTISGVTSFGLFVELDDIYIDGLLHVSALPSDYYNFDPTGCRLRGERSGVLYRLGNRIDVIVARVAPDDKKIDFNLADLPARKRRRAR